MSDTNPHESLEAEGIPDIEDHPPGMDVELDEESVMAPREYAVASGVDPAYPVTAADERLPESLAARAEREIPDVGAEELDVGGGVAQDDQDRLLDDGDDEPYVVGSFSAGTEAGAVPVDELAPPSYADETVATGTHHPGAAVYEPTSGDAASGEGTGLDDDGEALGVGSEDTDIGLSAEEAAMHTRRDDV